MNVEDKVREIISRASGVPVSEIKPEVKLSDLDMESLEKLECVMPLGDAFKLEITPSLFSPAVLEPWTKDSRGHHTGANRQIHPPMPIVFIDSPGGDYWKRWQAYVQNQLVSPDLVDESDLRLYKITDNIDDAVNEIRHFFHRDHSIRHTRDEVVLLVCTIR